MFQRGKFRPRLVDLAGSNPEDDVKNKSKEAFKKLQKGNLRGAIDSLSSLKGIGPATASGIYISVYSFFVLNKSY